MGSVRASFEHWLQSWLDSADPGARLPSQRALAEQWCLSPTTVARVIRPHISAGRLLSAPGAGMVVPGATPPVNAAVPTGQDAVRQRFQQAIAAGRWLDGEALPGQRALAGWLGVGRATVATIISQLIDHGLLHRRGRRVVVGNDPLLAKQAKQGQVDVFVDRDRISSSGWADCVMNLEAALDRHHLRLQIRPIGEWPRVVDLARNPERTRGVVVVTDHLDDPKDVDRVWQRFCNDDGYHRIHLLRLGVETESQVLERSVGLHRHAIDQALARRLQELIAGRQVQWIGTDAGPFARLVDLLSEGDDRSVMQGDGGLVASRSVAVVADLDLLGEPIAGTTVISLIDGPQCLVDGVGVCVVDWPRTARRLADAIVGREEHASCQPVIRFFCRESGPTAAAV